jgi:hypothetical protein
MSALDSYLDEIGGKDEVDDIDETGEFDDIDETGEFEDEDPDVDASPATSNVGETSVELNVNDLIAELEADMPKRSESEQKSARKRLEEILEERRAARELDGDDEFDLSY